MSRRWGEQARDGIVERRKARSKQVTIDLRTQLLVNSVTILAHSTGLQNEPTMAATVWAMITTPLWPLKPHRLLINHDAFTAERPSRLSARPRQRLSRTSSSSRKDDGTHRRQGLPSIVIFMRYNCGMPFGLGGQLTAPARAFCRTPTRCRRRARHHRCTGRCAVPASAATAPS